jgi:hypothetical protein
MSAYHLAALANARQVELRQQAEYHRLLLVAAEDGRAERRTRRRRAWFRPRRELHASRQPA